MKEDILKILDDKVVRLTRVHSFSKFVVLYGWSFIVFSCSL